MNDRLTVSVADLFPGSYLSPGTDKYVPRIGWEEYEQTFAMIENSPEVYAVRWPIYELWQDWCLQRFGALPSSGDPPGQGSALAWPCAANAFRRIAASFQKHGYKPELATGGEAEIEVAINGDGKIVVMQGNKRVALLRRHYGDCQVEVAVKHREDGWLQLLADLSKENGGEKLYQPLPHPEFADWPVTQPCQERLDMILGTLDGWTGWLLDIGCNTGWFCREFTKRDWACIGLDTNPLLIRIADIMQNWQYRKPLQSSFVQGDIANVASVQQFDICLCLSVIMHIFSQFGTEATWAILDAVSNKCGMMCLDCVWGGYSDALPFTPETLGDEIVAHTRFANYRLLGYSSHEHRPVYWFTK